MKRIFLSLTMALLTLPAPAEELPELTYSGESPRVQNPLSPEDSQKHIQTPDGFKAVLFASEPEIVNPIALSWDADGRLFVLQSVDYPHKFGKPTGGDKITICEDRNKDGKADRFTTFAENLSIGTGMVCVDGGVIVAMAPDIKFLQDTNGDSKADTTNVLFTGFGLNDTHAGPSNLALGHDNWIWGAVGYSGFKGNFESGEVRANKGVYRFTPDGKTFDFVGQFNNNTWGLGFTESFDIFGSTANNNHCVYVGIPKRYAKGKKTPNARGIQGHYEIKTVTSDPLQQVDVRGGYTAAAGANIYTARTYPKEYWNRIMFVCEPTGHVVHNAILEKDKAGFKEVDGGNLFASSDNWTAPVYAGTGPDGMVWVADWYNPVIQHNPDRRGMENQIWNAERGPGNAHLNPHRDTQHGRIYRVVYEEAAPQNMPRLRRGHHKHLLAALRHDNMFWRTTAQQMLVHRKQVRLNGHLIGLTRTREKDQLGHTPVATHAIRTLDGLGQFDGSNKKALDALYAALKHPSSDVRKAAIQALPETEDAANRLAASGVLKDKDLHTRLSAILRTIDLPDTKSMTGAIAKSAASPETDIWLSTALGLATGSGTATTQDSGQEQQNLPKADVTIVIKTIKEQMSYDKKAIAAIPGQTVEIIFENNDVMPHNLALIKPGSLAKFGAQADAYLTNPKAASRAYVPESEFVIAHTPMLSPGEKASIRFTAPKGGGKFPYVCTFPAHWRMMNGFLDIPAHEDFTLNKEGEKKVLITGGGSSHDFFTWFGKTDGAVFAENGARVDYTENTISPRDLSTTDLLVISNNKPFGEEWRKGIFAHASAAKPLLILHAGNWYNWADWPEFNKDLAGGGSKGHERYGTFDVTVINPNHPLAKGLPRTFEITDELYRWMPHHKGPSNQIIAVGKDRKTGMAYPVIWAVQHKSAKIACSTLGHDAKAHSHPAYQTFLKNVLAWARAE